MASVFLLHHVHEFDDGHEDVKFIGVYSTEDQARRTLERIKDQPGFYEHPAGFEISEHPLDKDSWLEGFVTIEPGEDSEKEDDSEEPAYFAYGAMLRVFGNSLDFSEITKHVGVEPTYTHRRGDRRLPDSPPYPHDMWLFKPLVAEVSPLHEHIDTLWRQIQPATSYLVKLKESVTVDVFLTYRSNIDTAGVEVPCRSLEIFNELEIPFGLSVIIV